MYMCRRVCTCTLFANITLRACILLSRGQTKVSYSRHRTMGVNPFDPMAGKCRLPTLTLRKAGGAFCPSLYSHPRLPMYAPCSWLATGAHAVMVRQVFLAAPGIYAIRMAGVAIVVGTRASVTARCMQHRPTDNSHRYDVQRHNNGRWGRASVQ